MHFHSCIYTFLFFMTTTTIPFMCAQKDLISTIKVYGIFQMRRGEKAMVCALHGEKKRALLELCVTGACTFVLF